MKKHWKILLIVFFIVPCIFAFKGCSCSKDKNKNNTTSSVEYTVTFYTDNPDFFNVPNQTIKDGGKVTPPLNFPKRKRDSLGRDYYFVGWFSNQSLRDEYIWKFETDTVHQNMELYAKWALSPTKTNNY